MLDFDGYMKRRDSSGHAKFEKIMKEQMRIIHHDDDTTEIYIEGDPVAIMKERYPEERDFIAWIEQFDT